MPAHERPEIRKNSSTKDSMPPKFACRSRQKIRAPLPTRILRNPALRALSSGNHK
ncbi:Uncharacterised protein [Vibrio cholerae]|nr:Uncharacterised protein [Vibrio cholerae]